MCVIQEKKKSIRVVLVEPGKRARETELGTELEDMQAAVGGDIEGLYPFDEQVCLVCNADGKRLCQPNRTLKDSTGHPYLVICGSFFLCDATGEYFESLSDEQVECYLKMFEYPERIGRTNGRLIAVPFKTNGNTKTNREER